MCYEEWEKRGSLDGLWADEDNVRVDPLVVYLSVDDYIAPNWSYEG